eukprot:SAG31_NODE_755_length_12319_cov_6.335542_1_plen_181_part_00
MLRWTIRSTRTTRTTTMKRAAIIVRRGQGGRDNNSWQEGGPEVLLDLRLVGAEDLQMLHAPACHLHGLAAVGAPGGGRRSACSCPAMHCAVSRSNFGHQLPFHFNTSTSAAPRFRDGAMLSSRSMGDPRSRHPGLRSFRTQARRARRISRGRRAPRSSTERYARRRHPAVTAGGAVRGVR